MSAAEGLVAKRRPRVQTVDEGVRGEASPSAPSRPDITDRFVGRTRELAELAQLVPRTSPVTVVAISGMPGVGKTFLAEHFAHKHQASFPGGLHRVALRPNESRTVAELLGSMAARVDVDPSHVVDNLRHSRGLVILDDVDHEAQVRVVQELTRRLARVPVVVVGRHAGMGRATGWPGIRLQAHARPEHALHQLRAEGIAVDDPEHHDDLHALTQAVGRLPLALSLLGKLVRGGHRTVAQLRQALDGVDPSKLRSVLRAVFDLSWQTLRDVLSQRLPPDRAQAGAVGLVRLAHGPSAPPIGASLAAAVCGLPEPECVNLLELATSLGLAQRTSHRRAWWLHPFIAMRLRASDLPVDEAALDTDNSAWFLGHLRAAAREGDERGAAARRILHEESEALDRWRLSCYGRTAFEAVEAGFGFAMDGGPYEGWIGACERAASGELDDAEHSLRLYYLGRLACRAGLFEQARDAAENKARLDERRGQPKGVAFAQGLLADVLSRQGDLEQALFIHQTHVLPVFERLGDARQKAVTVGKIADILKARGKLDQALHIRQHDELPIYEQLGDTRHHAITKGQIADILAKRGELDRALHVYQSEQLPVFESLGDERSKAVTLGRVADILAKRGELDRALHIHQAIRLPVFERLGDSFHQATTMGKIADIIQARGDFDRALYIRQSEELPVYERLGDTRSKAVTMGKIADILEARGHLSRALHIRENEELMVYDELGDTRARAITMGRIADILEARGEIDRAHDLRSNEELPVYERLGEVHARAVCLTNLAILRISQYDTTSRADATRMLSDAYQGFLRMGLPDARTVEQIAEHYDLTLGAMG